MTEEDPTAIEPTEGGDLAEPDSESLPPKPVVEGLPTDEELEAQDEPGDEDVLEDEFLNPEVAADDDTVDDAEHDD